MFSKTCEYAIRATIYIASEYKNEEKIGIHDICQNIEAPQHFVAKILQVLSRHDIVSSKKGVHGGFYITEEQRDTRLIDIVYAIDGDHVFTGCALGLKQCSETKPCPIHYKFKPVRENLKKVLQDTRIRELAENIKKGKFVLKALGI
ncbi:MAG: Rrf2 family transcriptional regulator [Taibaiella sp.]|nr:Rrf2 family transcriptional regulator [Taibaiella sp.]